MEIKAYLPKNVSCFTFGEHGITGLFLSSGSHLTIVRSDERGRYVPLSSLNDELAYKINDVIGAVSLEFAVEAGDPKALSDRTAPEGVQVRYVGTESGAKRIVVEASTLTEIKDALTRLLADVPEIGAALQASAQSTPLATLN